MVYVVTDQGVISGRSIKEINGKLQSKLEKEEFRSLGPDLVTHLTAQDIDFVQDKYRVSRIMFGNFFRKDNSVKLIALMNLIMTFLVLLTK